MLSMSLSVLPERNPNDFAQSQAATRNGACGSSSTAPNGVDRGRKALKNRPSHYSGKKKAHTDKNVVIVDAAQEMHRLLEPDLCRQDA